MQLIEPVISGTRRFDGDRSLNAKFVLTGASPNGAVWFYQQNGKNPDNAPGHLANKEIFADLAAVWLRVNFDFDW